MSISDYMDQRQVIFLNVSTRDEVVRALVHLLYELGKLKNEEVFYQAIIDREKVVSTGIGMGVAFPHARMPNYDQFFIAIGILQRPVDWHALDNVPVRLVFMIGGPDDKQTEYLQILSNLTQAVKDESRRKKLLTLRQPEAIIELFWPV